MLHFLSRKQRGVGGLMLLALSSALLTGCDKQPESEPSTVADIERPARIEQVQPLQSDGLVFNGTVRAAQRAELAFKVRGRVDKVLVNEGDRVQQGDLLAQLDDREFQTALGSARAEYASADADYKRGKAIYDRSQAISKSDLEKLATQRSLAANRLKEAQLALEETRLLAPFAGIVGRKLVDDFAQIGANQTLIILQNLQELEVMIQVPDKVVLQNRRDREVVARIVGLEQSFPLTLKFFATEADPVTQTYQAIFGLGEKGDAPVLPGMSAQVFVTSGESAGKQVAVPLSAVVPDNQGQQYVWKVNDESRAQRQDVAVGTLLGNKVVITQGLRAGDRIITAGVRSVHEGMPVRPMGESGE
ncbi:efflux RND transporter periplasmic adaptor subunit [Marinobacterium maritimum]|uniref:Efflux RND transporter periplasmic adaptor subunit n=1 Tax=Marinobacterium maritimum TaxID=500162 RepID=A0ABN1I6X8_9GAMM